MIELSALLISHKDNCVIVNDLGGAVRTKWLIATMVNIDEDTIIEFLPFGY